MKYNKSIFSYTTKNYRILNDLGVKEPYVWCAHIKENLDVDYDFSTLLKLRKLGFDGVPMIESHYKAELNVSRSHKKIIDVVKKFAKFSKEIMIDIESQLKVYLPLFKTIRRNYPYHISACFEPHINKEIVKYVDKITPMMYDFGKCIYRYEERTRRNIEEVLKLKKEFSLGLPLIATIHEIEIAKNGKGKIVERNRHNVLDYAEIALRVAKEYGVFRNKNFKGIVWWGLIQEPMKVGAYLHYPYLITKERAKQANALLTKYIK